MSSVPEQAAQPLPMIQVDQEQIHRHLDQVVRDSVEQTLNALLDAEADELCGAKRYERSPERLDTRAGHYTRQLHTKAGEVTLKVPKLRNLSFETAIIERYRRRETSVEEALVEMYLAGVSTRRVEDITEALWGTRVSSSTVSELNKRIYGQIEQWRNRPISGRHPYLFLDGIWLKRCWGGEVRNVAVLVAVGVNGEGYREVLGVMEGAKEDKDSWVAFLRYLKGRGLSGVRLIVSDKCLGRLRRCVRRCPVPRPPTSSRSDAGSRRLDQKKAGERLSTSGKTSCSSWGGTTCRRVIDLLHYRTARLCSATSFALREAPEGAEGAQ
jgi:putative transposase